MADGEVSGRAIPYYPFWSILIIAVDVFVIWALAAQAEERMRR